MILADKVRFDVNYKVLIKKGDSTFRLSSFSNEIPSRLSVIYKVAQNFTSEQLEDVSTICLSCLTNLAINNDLYIDMANYGNDTVIFTITDKKIPIKNDYYQFTFANKYG